MAMSIFHTCKSYPPGSFFCKRMTFLCIYVHIMYFLGKLIRTRPTSAHGGAQEPGPQGPTGAHKGSDNKRPGGSQEPGAQSPRGAAWPTSAQRDPQGPCPQGRGAAHKRKAHKSPGGPQGPGP